MNVKKSVTCLHQSYNFSLGQSQQAVQQMRDILPRSNPVPNHRHTLHIPLYLSFLCDFLRYLLHQLCIALPRAFRALYTVLICRQICQQGQRSLCFCESLDRGLVDTSLAVARECVEGTRSCTWEAWQREMSPCLLRCICIQYNLTHPAFAYDGFWWKLGVRLWVSAFSWKIHTWSDGWVWNFAPIP